MNEAYEEGSAMHCANLSTAAVTELYTADIVEMKESINLMLSAYLYSEYADCQQARSSVLFSVECLNLFLNKIIKISASVGRN